MGDPQGREGREPSRAKEDRSPLWALRVWDAGTRYARSPHASFTLAALSAAEAVFFPIPPDAMLGPLAAAHPRAAARFALIATGASLLGGLVGYLIGMVAFEAVGRPLLEALGVAHHIPRVAQWFQENTFSLLFLAAFTPIPFKVFTILGGALSAPLAPFFLASALGRGLRFFGVALLAATYGERTFRTLAPHINRILLLGALVGLGYVVWRAAGGY